MRLLGRTRLLVLLLAVALGAAACVEPLPEEADQTSTTEEGTPAPTDPGQVDPDEPDQEDEAPRSDLPPGVADALIEIGGRWAVTSGHEVVVVDLADLSEVTVDGAGASAAAQPVWSPDGSTLAWTVFDDSAGRGLTQVRRGDGSLPWSPASAYPVADLPGTLAFYLQWSGGFDDLIALVPAGGDPSSEIAALYLDPEGGTQPLVTGSPIWVDWSPDGTRALLHVDDERVGLFDPSGPTVGVQEVLATEQPFVVASWLDDLTFLAAADGALSSYDDTGDPVLELLSTSTSIRSILSLDGTHLAFTGTLAGESTGSDEIAEAEPDELDDGTESGDAEGEPTSRPGPDDPESDDDTPDDAAPDDPAPDDAVPEGDGSVTDPTQLRVLEIATGDIVTVTETPVAAWEWSPDGSTLAYLADAEAEGVATVAYGQQTQQERTELRWHFWSDGILVNATSPFVPTDLSVSAYLPFFEQYAVSHTRWAPDGSAFVFAGTVVDDDGPRSGVHVQFVEALTDSFWITNGDEAFWSPTGGGGGGTSIL